MLPSAQSQHKKLTQFSKAERHTVEGFLLYDFESDATFKAGWEKVTKFVDDAELEEKFQKAKIFYYSKHVEKLSKPDVEYLLKDKLLGDSSQNEVLSDVLKADILSDEQNKIGSFDTAGSSKGVSKEINEPCVAAVCELELSTEYCNSMSELQLSFQEVVEYIQKGETIPGIEQINVQPLDRDPMPSIMTAPKKPWE